MSETKDGKSDKDLTPFLKAANRLNYKLFGAGLLVAFASAFFLAWLLFAPPKETPPPPPPPARTLTGDDMRDFFQAVGKEDYGRMSDLGRDLFKEGTIIPDSVAKFAEYETTSYPPHMVYAFYSFIGGDKARRVLLTMDEGDRVVSFLAEEMEIAK